MSTSTHLAELTEQHNALETELDTELAKLTPDTVKVNDLKKRKLQVKDEIARLQTQDEQVA